MAVLTTAITYYGYTYYGYTYCGCTYCGYTYYVDIDPWLGMQAAG